jgi:hypothetical protein
LAHSFRERWAGRWAKVPWGLVGCLALILVIERSIARRDLEFRAPIEWDWVVAEKLAGEAASSADVLILGDSLAKEGLIPRVIEQRTGLSVRNLAVSAGSPPLAFALLRHAIEAGARPGLVVVEMEPHLLEHGKDYLRQHGAYVLEPREIAELAWRRRDGHLLASLGVERLLPSARSREEIRAHTVARVRGEASRNAVLCPPMILNWRQNGGALVVPGDRRFDGKLSDLHHLWFPHAFHPDPVALQYADRTFRLLRERGIRACLLIPPLARAATDRRRAEGVDAAHRRWIRELATRHEGLSVLDATALDLSDDHFHDPFHLNELGAAELSARVAEVIARLEPAGRWVALDAIEPRPDLLALKHENLTESRRRLDAPARRIDR